MEIAWRIISVSDVKTYWELNKKSFVIEELTQYPNSLQVDLLNDKISLLDPYKVWDVITVWLNFRVREGQSGSFNNVNWWRITNGNTQTAKTKPTVAQTKPEVQTEDLPF